MTVPISMQTVGSADALQRVHDLCLVWPSAKHGPASRAWIAALARLGQSRRSNTCRRCRASRIGATELSVAPPKIMRVATHTRSSLYPFACYYEPARGSWIFCGPDFVCWAPSHFVFRGA